MRFNIWMGIDLPYQQDLRAFIVDGTESIDYPAINTMLPETIEFFRTVYDSTTLERLFKTWQPGERNYRVWSFYMNKPDNASLIKDDLDRMIEANPQELSILGAWKYETGEEAGDPVWYPIPQQVVKFMPDIMVDPGDPTVEPPIPPTYEPATEPTDVNLLFGQAPRSFSSFYDN